MKLFQVMITALLIAAPSWALADAAGTAKGVDPQADAALNGETRTLVVGADVFLGDLIQTGPKGQVQILFADDTRLVVGPSSSLTIEDYLIRNDGSAGKLAVDMLSGAFRFITGDSAKNLYEINTPTGTIGIRGTKFDVVAQKKGPSYVLLYLGELRFCTDEGKCKTLTNACELGEIADLDTEILGIFNTLDDKSREDFRGKFEYAENQSPLLRDFWVANSRDCVIKSNAPDVPETDDSPGQPVNPTPPVDPTPPPPPPPIVIGNGRG